MQVSQRSTSSSVNGYGSVDRWEVLWNGADESPVHSRHDLTSGDTGPWAEGHRYSLHVLNGDQTSVGAADVLIITTKLEAQTIAASGWNYNSASSYLTLSFWVKSLEAQNFYGRLQTTDGTAQNYPFETGSLSANTWTKITKKIPGHANLTFDNSGDVGLTVEFDLFRGTDKTGSVSLDTWAAYASATRVPDMTSTWWTTNNSTFEIAGVQLEVGSSASKFDHVSYFDELQRCKRYYQRSTDSSQGTNYTLELSSWNSPDAQISQVKSGNYYDWRFNWEVEMRTAPTFTFYGSSTEGDIHIEAVGVGSKEVDWNSNTVELSDKGCCFRHIEDGSDGNYTSGSGNAFGNIAYTAEAEL